MDKNLLGLLGIGVVAYLFLKKKEDETVAIVSNTTLPTGEPTLPPIEPTPTTLPIFGCTDPQGINFNSAANFDDGSCAYTVTMPVEGCMDSSAANFDSAANFEADGSCQYPPAQVIGCTDPLAENFNPSATIGCSNTSPILTPYLGGNTPVTGGNTPVSGGNTPATSSGGLSSGFNGGQFMFGNY